MASSERLGEVNQVMRTKDAAKKEDFINGITDGLEDFTAGRYKHFKDDDELEAYLMSLWIPNFRSIMAFESIVTAHFSKNFHELTDKNPTFKKQIINKMKGIRQNPEMGVPKSHKLRGLRGLHISEHFVIVYLIYKNYIIFIELEHHDKAYDTSEGLMERILEDGRLLSSLDKLGISSEEFAHFVRSLRKHK
jgi:mRNA-degrading endonuclease RelE of RelBE toxin-antitoxin system